MRRLWALVPAAIIVLGAVLLQRQVGDIVWYVMLIMLGGLVTTVWGTGRHRP